MDISSDSSFLSSLAIQSEKRLKADFGLVKRKRKIDGFSDFVCVLFERFTCITLDF